MARLDEVKTFTQQGLAEFKAFIQRGNVIDLAVAVVIGAAFTKVVNSLVGDILTPVLGVATEGSNIFSAFDIPIWGQASIKLGAFLQAVINFLIVAFCIFMLVKGVTTLQKRFVKEEPKPAEMTTQEKLLAEIRDLLKAQQPATASVLGAPVT